MMLVGQELFVHSNRLVNSLNERQLTKRPLYC